MFALIIVPFILMEFHVRRKRYFAENHLRKPPILIFAWRTVQIFLLQVNQAIGVALVPFHTIFGQLCVTVVCMLLRQYNTMNLTIRLLYITWGLMGFLFWFVALFVGGCVHLYSKRTLNSWKYNNWKGLSKQQLKELNKFRKSCPPLSIAYERAYVIRRLSALKFVRALSRGVFRVLLTLKF